jgi:hypothetical protein
MSFVKRLIGATYAVAMICRGKGLSGIGRRVFRPRIALLDKIVTITIALTNFYLQKHPLQKQAAIIGPKVLRMTSMCRIKANHESISQEPKTATCLQVSAFEKRAVLLSNLWSISLPEVP